MEPRKTRRRRDRGAAAVEFAFVAMPLVIILFGIIEFGYIFFVQAQVAGAARDGVRNYAINYSKPNAAATAIGIAKSATPVASNVNSARFEDKSGNVDTCSPDKQIFLVLTYQYHSLTGLLDPVLKIKDFEIIGRGSMACGG